MSLDYEIQKIGYTFQVVTANTTLTNASPYITAYNGTGEPTITLPSTATLNIGRQFKIVNESAASVVTVNTSTGTAFSSILEPGTSSCYTVVSQSANGVDNWIAG